MSLVIGLDLDNTIIGYDSALRQVASEMGCAPIGWDGTKKALRDSIRLGSGGDLLWQQVQARIYGSHIDHAKFNTGFHEFVHAARSKGHKLCVVSHKTEVSPVDAGKVLLRVAAIHWLDRNGFFSKLGFHFNDLHFCSNQDEKAKKIADIGCDLFIDDLEEVFENRFFPISTRKLLFAPLNTVATSSDVRKYNSWRLISEIELNYPNPETVAAICSKRFPHFQINEVTPLQGRGNSKVFKLHSGANQNQHFLLKIYPDLVLDPRERLETEFSAVGVLKAHGLPVPAAIGKCHELNWGVYEWVDGCQPKSPDLDHIRQATFFLDRLSRIPANKLKSFGLASEACVSGSDLEYQIETRLALYRQFRCEQLEHFVISEVKPVYQRLIQLAKEKWPTGWETELPTEYRVPSPSDFGFHNALQTANGELVFVDFEYFGWDDPVKMVADLFWHPALSHLDGLLHEDWIEELKERFLTDVVSRKRFRLALPLYGIRWALIILNVARKQWERYGNQEESVDLLNTVTASQVGKARLVLSRLEKLSGGDFER